MIHTQGGPKTPTEAQMTKARDLDERGVYVYLEKGTGKAIVRAFKNFLEFGEVNYLSKGLYHFLTMKCGYIAHFDLDTFRHRYADPADLVDKVHDNGSLFGGDAWSRPVEHTQSVYTDGMTSLEVYEGMKDVAMRHYPAAVARREARRREGDLDAARTLAAAHGFKVVEA